jgi:hypothetical protein
LGWIVPAHPSPTRLWDHAGELATASMLAKPIAIATLTEGRIDVDFIFRSFRKFTPV